MDGIKLLADIAGKVCLGAFDFRCDRVADDEIAEPFLGLVGVAAQKASDECEVHTSRTVIRDCEGISRGLRAVGEGVCGRTVRFESMSALRTKFFLVSSTSRLNRLMPSEQS